MVFLGGGRFPMGEVPLYTARAWRQLTEVPRSFDQNALSSGAEQWLQRHPEAGWSWPSWAKASYPRSFDETLVGLERLLHSLLEDRAHHIEVLVLRFGFGVQALHGYLPDKKTHKHGTLP